jgi:hypothetical protein
MAMITCSECGRAISNKAASCIGCGAPVATPELGYGVVAPPAPLPMRTLWRHLLLSAGLSLLGLGLAVIADHRPDSGRWLALIAALLLIGGICWLIVTLVRLWSHQH